MSDQRLQKLIITNQIGPSNLQEIFEGEDGKRYERLTQRIDRLSGRLEERVKGATRDIYEAVTIQEYVEPTLISSSAEARTRALLAMPEAERQAIIAEKFRKKREKKESRQEAMRIAQLDEEELMEEAKKSESQRKMEAMVAERQNLAVQNVDAQRKMKAEMLSKGANRTEIKKAIRTMKFDQAEKLEKSDEPEKKETKGKRKGRPRKAALKNPRKDPETGLMVSSE